MLNGLAGYIFGRRPGVGDGETNANAAPTAGRLTAANETTNNDIEDDDWILVSTEEPVVNCNDDKEELDLISIPSSRESSGSSSPVSTVEALGWNLTPPPCFIASQQRSLVSKNRPAGTVAKLQTDTTTNNGGEGSDEQCGQRSNHEFMDVSIFENLLIEHPSMSVYHHHHRSKMHPTTVVDSTVVHNPTSPPLVVLLPTPTVVCSPQPPSPPPLKTQGLADKISRANQKYATYLSNAADADVKKIAISSNEPIRSNDDRVVDDESIGDSRNSTTTVVVRRNNNLVDLLHYFDGAFRLDVIRAATVAQQRVERAAKAKDFCPNRIRRQNLTTQYDGSLGKGKQRKNRMKVFSGRSNDRKCQ